MSAPPAAWLTLEAEGDSPTFPLGAEGVVIGRLLDLEVVLGGDGISRRHARVVPEGGGWAVEDLGSRNGTRVGGAPLPPGERRILQEGDRIQVGGHVLRFTAGISRVVRRLATTALLREARGPRGDEGDPRLGLLLSLGEALSGAPTAQEILDRLGACAQAALRAEAVFIGQWDGEGGRWLRAAARGDAGPPPEAVSREVLASGEALLLEEAAGGLCVPLGAPPAPGGILWARPRGGEAFGEGALRFAAFLGIFAGFATRGAEAADRSRRRAEALEPPHPPPAGPADPMAAVEARLPLISRASCPALILGETGTGKTTLARALHRASPRGGGPFVAVNCAAIPEALLEAELFGLGPRSGIAGADPRGRPGRFEQADGGTLFLDEIGDMPLAQQAKILTALEARAVQRLGDTREIQVDTRLVAATSRDLEAEIEAGRFRADLYHRLARAVIELPPLRDRLGELPALTAAALSRLREEIPGTALPPTPAAMAALSRWPWPGNLRELENALAHALLACPVGEPIDAHHLPPRVLEEAGEGGGVIVRILRDASALTELERARRDVLVAAVKRTGSLTRAAKELGFSKQWAIKLAKRYGVQVVQRYGG